MRTDNHTRKFYRAIGHKLHPVVIISKGISDNITAEINRALNDHELIKIRVIAADKDEKKALVTSICTTSGAELIQMAGHVALIYRKAKKVKPELSNLHRYKMLMAE